MRRAYNRLIRHANATQRNSTPHKTPQSRCRYCMQNGQQNSTNLTGTTFRNKTKKMNRPWPRPPTPAPSREGCAVDAQTEASNKRVPPPSLPSRRKKNERRPFSKTGLGGKMRADIPQIFLPENRTDTRQSKWRVCGGTGFWQKSPAHASLVFSCRSPSKTRRPTLRKKPTTRETPAAALDETLQALLLP